MIINRDMDNGFRPELDQIVRVVGRCHKNLLGVVGKIIEVDSQGFSIIYKNSKGEELVTAGSHGGLEPAEIALLVGRDGDGI